MYIQIWIDSGYFETQENQSLRKRTHGQGTIEASYEGLQEEQLEVDGAQEQ